MRFKQDLQQLGMIEKVSMILAKLLPAIRLIEPARSSFYEHFSRALVAMRCLDLGEVCLCWNQSGRFFKDVSTWKSFGQCAVLSCFP